MFVLSDILIIATFFCREQYYIRVRLQGPDKLTGAGPVLFIPDASDRKPGIFIICAYSHVAPAVCEKHIIGNGIIGF